MELTLLDNGIDSLQKTKKAIDKISELQYHFSGHHIKDAIIFMHHGTEILVKKYLIDINESLIFVSQKNYLKAKKSLKSNPVKSTGFGYFAKNRQNVFNLPNETKSKFDLRTIGLGEALDRVKYFCDVEVSSELDNSIEKLIQYRNDLTHYTLQLEIGKTKKLIVELKATFNLVLEFLEKILPGTMIKVDEEKFEITQDEWKEYQENLQTFYEERALADLSESDL